MGYEIALASKMTISYIVEYYFTELSEQGTGFEQVSASESKIIHSQGLQRMICIGYRV